MANFNKYVQQAHQLLNTARVLNDEANRTGLVFVNRQLETSKEFAQIALAAFSAGERGDAKQAAAAAKTAYRTVQRCLPKLLVQGGQRDLVVRKLRTVTPLIEELSTTKQASHCPTSLI